ncbi:hypothetical protein MHI24_22930 [Paenibacillus sp. FSL K6-1096]|uniref:hypothetical protein n=1 Tax=Paenibacillus sp. FSL K6-1096 TaxID=2921460 RepID=UPI0030ED8833
MADFRKKAVFSCNNAIKTSEWFVSVTLVVQSAGRVTRGAVLQEVSDNLED